MASLTEQLDAMSRLPENWDGYNADRIAPGPVTVAKEIVRFLEEFVSQFGPKIREIRVYPARTGGVQIEWEDDAFETELGIEVDGRMEFLHVNKATGVMTTAVVPTGIGAVQPEFLHQLRRVIAA